MARRTLSGDVGLIWIIWFGLLVIWSTGLSCKLFHLGDHQNNATSSAIKSTPQDLEVSSPEGESIAECVFRYQLEHIIPVSIPQPCFLSLGNDQNPPDEFIKRFRAYPFPVRKFSESIYQNGRITEKSTKRQGIRLVVSRIRLTSRIGAEVEGMWLIGFGDYQRQMFFVHKNNGRWSVNDVKVMEAP